MRARLLAFAFFLPTILLAQDDLQPLFDAFAKERAAIPGDAAEADKLAARAAQSRKADNAGAAARLIRDARWALPITPKDLPTYAKAFGVNRLRHGERVNAVRYNAAGTQLLTSSNDRSVRIWDVPTGQDVSVFWGSTDGMIADTLRASDAVFLPDGERMASISASGQQIHVWNLKTGKLLLTMTPKWPEAKAEEKKTKQPYIIKCLASTGEDGQSLVSGSDDKIVRVWNLQTGKETFTSTALGHRIEAVAAHPRRKYFAALDANGFLTVFDPTSGNTAHVMQAQVTDAGTAAGYAVRYSPDALKFLIGGADRVPKLVPGPAADNTMPANAAGAAQKLPAHEGEVLAVAFLPDGEHYVSAGRDKKVRVSNDLGEIVRQFAVDAEVICLDVRPDGRQIAVGCDDGTVRLFDFQTKDEQRSTTDAKEPLWATTINAEGTLFATGGADKTVRVYSAAGTLLHSLEGATAAVTNLVFLDQTKLVSAGGDKVLRLWDAKAGKALGEWPAHATAVLALAATPDGKSLVSGAADKIVNGWDTATGKIAWTWTARSVITALAIAKDGKTVLVGGADGGLSVLAIKDGNATLSGHANVHISGVAGLAYNPDFSRVASVGGDGIPKLWSIPATGNPVSVLWFKPAVKASPNVPVALSGLAFSPDGAYLAAAGADKLIRLYDTRTGAETRFLRGCTDWVTSLAFLPDGDRLLAVAADRAVRVFDVTRFEALATPGHASPTRAVALSPDGKFVISLGDDRTIRLWDRATGKPAGSIPASMDKFFTATFLAADLLAGGQGGSLSLWNLTQKKEIAALPSLGEAYGLMPSADGTRVGIFSRLNDANSYEVYAAELKKPQSTIVERFREITCASFRPDLAHVASGDKSGRVLLWDFNATTHWPRGWQVGPNKIIDLGFSPDGKRLAVAAEDGTVTLAEADTFKVLATVQPGGKKPYAINAIIVAPVGNRFALLHDGPEIRLYNFAGKELKTIPLPVTANLATFSADGKTLVTANVDGSVYVIDLD